MVVVKVLIPGILLIAARFLSLRQQLLGTAWNHWSDFCVRYLPVIGTWCRHFFRDMCVGRGGDDHSCSSETFQSGVTRRLPVAIFETLSTTFPQTFGRGDGLWTTTCLRTVVGVSKAILTVRCFRSNEASFCVTQI